jgi:hypothetical protein
MQVGQAQVLKVADMLAEAAEIFAEQIHVQGAAHDPLRLEPIGLILSAQVQAAQAVVSFRPRPDSRGQYLADVVEEVVPLSVQLQEDREKRRPVMLQPRVKFASLGLVDLMCSPDFFQLRTKSL